MTPSLTPFAGLESLEPGDLLSADGFRFQSINPSLTDRLLQIGAITHRHDAHAALADPAVAAGLTASPEGGTIPSGTNVSVAHTWVDTHGGETLAAPPATLVTAGGLLAPQNAPTLTPDLTAGVLLAGNYDYALTVTDGVGGETEIGPSASVVIDPGSPTARVKVTGLKVILEEVKPGIGAAKWRLWRRQEGGAWYLMATGVAAEVVDDGTLVGDCTVEPPARATTEGTNSLKVVVPEAPVGTEFFRLYLAVDGDFTSPCFIAQYPLGEIGKTIVLTTLATAAGAPPLVSTSYPGANKIDPDTDLLNFHWKSPKATLVELEALTEGNEEGDMRFVIESKTIYYWNGAAWVALKFEGTPVCEGIGFSVAGAVAVGTIPGKFIHVLAGEAQHLIGVQASIAKGKIKVSVLHNGAAVEGLKELALEAGAPILVELEAAVELKSGDTIELAVETVAGEPDGLMFTAFNHHA